ncbi:glycosyltransferase [Lactobacillus gallinarum]|uniref:Glycosyltransferase 2-like domain-containing protein n=1 Tax=Lactobacillus gallinarum TaxID=52242 RepID=A0A1Y4UCF9_9LACO|nr:glycosyltransferase [Lactobacillus gallinarum]OUQ55158.1 hypothetical protein B5E59_08510 [Lactobacillus gallinarum]OUQ74363.1 hypothetical protein B5E44_09905 [Lactobacillus gallinarum]
MNISPIFSVIIPVYQGKDFLAKCVDRIKNQTFKNVEIILVDDGSTDGSADICDKIARKNDNVIVIHKKNGGVSSARNVGIKVSTGKWIIFVDSDDAVSKVMCENFFNYIIQNNSYDFVACNFASEKDKLLKHSTNNKVIWYLNDYKKNISLINHMLLSDYNNLPKKFKKSFGSNIILNSPCAKAYKREFLIKNNVRFQKNIKYAEDLLFNIEVLMNKAKGVYVDAPVYFYRLNLNSATKKAYVPGILENYVLFKKVAKKLVTRNNLPMLENSIDAYCAKSALWVLPADVFCKNNSIKKSMRRFYQITNSEDFSELLNWTILKKLKNVFTRKLNYKCRLVLKKNFLILFFWYRILKKE